MSVDVITKEEDVSVGNVVRLGRDWTALILLDGSVLIQNLSSVRVGGSGQIVDLLNNRENFSSISYYLKDMDTERVGVRTLLLKTDGSVITDPDAISPSGVLSNEAYEAIPSTQESAIRYFSRKSNKSNW